ncbi:MAG: Rieske 2Fe-2S domain-containing protein [Actinobacteria bacterium]|nr:Rieske 2Fe-2S domain-containing protein [Actinomycetota bacterium]MCA1722115.1 Rieske 2Fe-2S domain-containing protein [Actinomycetota bacterium]
MFPFDKLDRLEELTFLDPVVAPLRNAVQTAIRPQGLRDVLHGTWLGHPLHAVLVQVPIGSFASAAILDLLGSEDAEDGADLLALTGLLSAVPAAVAGATDWSSANPSEERSGLVHAALNTVGLAAWIASLLARRRGHRSRGTALGLAGLAAIGVSGTIGGHLSYRRSLGANSNSDIEDTGPADWTDAGSSELPEGKPVLRQANGTPVLLVKTGARVDALVDLCSHQSGPLHEGTIADGCVTCPWHGSRFRLDDGSVVDGPSTHPQPALDVRISGDRLQVKLRG